MIIYSCNLCDVNVRPCPQRIRLFWIYHLIFSGFKNSLSTILLTDSLWMYYFPLWRADLYPDLVAAYGQIKKNIQICVDCWISFFKCSNNNDISNICWVRHKSFDNGVFFLEYVVMVSCHCVKEALHFYVKAALLFNSQTDTNI